MSSVASFIKIGFVAVLFAVVAHFCMLTPALAKICDPNGQSPFQCGSKCCNYKEQCIDPVKGKCDGCPKNRWGCGPDCCAVGETCVGGVCTLCAGEPCGGICCPNGGKSGCDSNGNGVCN